MISLLLILKKYKKAKVAKIGIVNSGGDCAGLNTVIAAVVKTGVRMGYEFVGFDKGWEGILDLNYQTLDLDAVRGISHLGGTILKTTNKGRFAGKVGAGGVNAIPTQVLEEAKHNLKQIGVDGLIVIGGDGTLSAAMQLSDFGVPIIGVPKTTDNDLSGNDQTFGFSTAVDVAVEALDRIHTTATSHDRVFLVECMGRHSGWIALYAGLAANANMILLPEFEVHITSVVDFLHRRLQRRGSAIIVVAEGIKLPQRAAAHAGSETKLAGISFELMEAIEREAPEAFEMRNVVLGHTQRGGNPNVEDRILSKKYGIAAVEAYESGAFGSMVRLRNGVIETVPIKEATGALKLVNSDTPEYIAAQKLGVYVNS